MTINISGQVPPKDRNSMYDLEERWTEIPDPDAEFAIVRIVRDGLTLKPGDKPRKAVLRFTDILVVGELEAEGFARRIAEQQADRAGEDTPLDMDAAKSTDGASGLDDSDHTAAGGAAGSVMERPEPQWADDEDDER